MYGIVLFVTKYGIWELGINHELKSMAFIEFF